MSGRGLEKGLYGDEPPKPTAPSVSTGEQIKKIVSFDTGWIKVKMDDDETYKRSGGTISWRYNNPGNLKYGDFARANGALGKGWGGHAVFPTFEDGLKAQKELLFSDARGYNNLSILQAMNKYAPSNDTGAGVPAGGNKPNKYAAFLAKQLKVADTTKLSALTAKQQDAMLIAMHEYEGFRKGAVAKV